MKHLIPVLVLVALLSVAAFAQSPSPSPAPTVAPYRNFSKLPSTSFYLWPKGAPLANGTDEKDKPRIAVFLPKQPSTTSSVIICPGGGYGGLSEPGEGSDLAIWFNGLGLTAFVLEYRVSPYHHPVELMDAARGMRWVRSHAAEYHISPDRIGIVGSSAGGHLAATLSTLYDEGDKSAEDPIDRLSSKPAFTILLYPVLSPQAKGTEGSLKKLLGEPLDPKSVELLSPEKHVTAQTPPAFLAAADDDHSVDATNSAIYWKALHDAAVPAELHIFQRGAHGFGVGWADFITGQWRQLCINWMLYRGLLSN
jgi:acetyl esterase/lipase